MIRILIPCLALGLAGCGATQAKIATSVYATSTGYDLAEKSATALEKVATPEQKATIKKLDNDAWNVIHPIEANHNNVTADEALGASTALTLLTSQLLATGVK